MSFLCVLYKRIGKKQNKTKAEFVRFQITVDALNKRRRKERKKKKKKLGKNKRNRKKVEWREKRKSPQ